MPSSPRRVEVPRCFMSATSSLKRMFVRRYDNSCRWVCWWPRLIRMTYELNPKWLILVAGGVARVLFQSSSLRQANLRSPGSFQNFERLSRNWPIPRPKPGLLAGPGRCNPADLWPQSQSPATTVPKTISTDPAKTQIPGSADNASEETARRSAC